MKKHFKLFAGVLVLSGFAHVSQAQPTLKRTIVVDPNGAPNANYSTISAAVGDPQLNDPTNKWTILIYPGTYAESVVLSDTKENVDLIGVDRDSVIIQPPADSAAAVIIDGVGARNHRISNLTIITNDSTVDEGDGILMKNSITGAGINGITIDNATIRCDGANSHGIRSVVGVANLEIRNVTISTTTDHCKGIYLQNSGAGSANDFSNVRILNPVITCKEEISTAINLQGPSKQIEISNAILRCETFTSSAILASDTETFVLHDSDILVRDGKPVVRISGTSNDVRLLNTSIVGDKNFGHITPGHPDADDTAALEINAVADLRMAGCKVKGRKEGIILKGNVMDAVISGCDIRGSHYGVYMECGDGIQFQNCLLIGDSANGQLGMIPILNYYGVYIKNATGCSPGMIRFQGCDIRATSNKVKAQAQGVTVSVAPSTTAGPIQLIDCAINAQVTVADTNSAPAKAFGVVAEQAEAVLLKNGVVSSSDVNKKQDDQYDLKNAASSGLGIRVSGTRFTKWKGPIGPAVQAQSLIRRVLNVADASPTAILGATTLTGSEQSITSGLNSPDAYRVLSATRSQSGSAQTVYIIGTDFGGNPITDKITFQSSDTMKEGNKPFNTVTEVILPAGTGTISIGTTRKFGLTIPISATGNVQQQGRKATGANNPYNQSDVSASNVDAVYGTVDVGSTINTGDSFEWGFLGNP